MLTLPTEVANLIATGRVEKRVLLRVDFDGGPEGVWNGDYTVTIGGVAYAPLAGNMVLGDIQSSLELDADTQDVMFPGMMAAVAQLLEAGDWHQRPGVVSIGILNGAGEVIHTIPRFSGFCDDAPTTGKKDEPRTVQLKLESNNRGLYRESSRVCSDNDQRLVPGASLDGFYKYCNTASVTEANIPWGRAGEQYPVKPR